MNEFQKEGYTAPARKLADQLLVFTTHGSDPLAKAAGFFVQLSHSFAKPVGLNIWSASFFPTFIQTSRMISSSDIFEQPENFNQKIWRYFDLAKFLDALNSSSIFFSRADLLGDKFEGSISFPTAEDTEGMIDSLRGWSEKKVPLQEEDVGHLKRARSFLSKDFIKMIGISCWHMSDHESAAMWALYSKVNEGIAIQSTYDKLYNALNEVNIRLFLGVVKYIDFRKTSMGHHILSPFIHKRQSYEHEKEIRAVFTTVLPENTSYEWGDAGCKVKINLPEFIDNIYISPGTPQWQFKLIQALVEKYLPGTTIKRSELEDDPLY